MTDRLPLLCLALLLTACQTPRPGVPASSISYHCDDGRTLRASYPDADTALLTLDGRVQRLHSAISASGARYIGDGWQWWTKGLRDARLAPLAAGETYAVSAGVACHAQ
jgi:membrane-bound inhibitor of C-type lysozyme